MLSSQLPTIAFAQDLLLISMEGVSDLSIFSAIGGF